MRRLLASSLVLTLALAACSRPAEVDSTASEPERAVAESTAADAAAAPAAEAKAASEPAPERAAIVLPQVAYSYAYSIAAPARAIRDLVGRHEAACLRAGPMVCQVVGSSVQEAGDDRIAGELTLRATPQWLTGFRSGLAKEAEGAGGRIAAANVASEDLSRRMVDTEASIRAMTTLRDRLQQHLASRPGKLSELLELERELAEVQGRLDATRSELAVMRGRVAMSEVKLSYQSAGVLAPQGVFAPLAEAVSGVLGAVVSTLAAMVVVLAWGLPWALLVGAVAWAWRRRQGKLHRTPAA
jgi:hypothetical protein